MTAMGAEVSCVERERKEKHGMRLREVGGRSRYIERGRADREECERKRKNFDFDAGKLWRGTFSLSFSLLLYLFLIICPRRRGTPRAWKLQV